MDLDDQLREVVKMLKGRVYILPKPAVYISGGLDSTILLHHLKEKTKKEIYTTLSDGRITTNLTTLAASQNIMVRFTAKLFWTDG